MRERAAGDVDPLDPRLQYAFGQVAPDVGDRVADVVDSAVDRRADDELDEGLRSSPRRRWRLISSTPLIPRTAASMRWVTWVSISVGAAPGCETKITAAGNSMSGLSLTSIRMKLTSPSRVSAANRTSGKIGFRIAQLEILRISRT